MKFINMDDPVVETKNCASCHTPFEITEWDVGFYEKVDVPRPTWCNHCRRWRRLVHINQVNLFERKCDATGETIVANYPPDSPYKVYDQAYWAGDKFDATEYGRDYDFDRPFFEQFQELSLAVPRPSKMTDFVRDENSVYTNDAGKNKDCYFIFDSDENWDCLYSYGMHGSRSSMDSYRVQNLELCHEVVDSQKCYNCSHVYNSENCTDSYFLNQCTGCKYCIMCSNLKQKKYHIMNQPVSEEEFEAFKAQLGSHEFVKAKVAEFAEYKLKFPHKYMRGFFNENVSGNHLVHCKNVAECFDSMNCWDEKYCAQMFIKSKDSMDIHEGGECELCYESSNLGYNGFNLRWCHHSLEQLTNLTYCCYCFIGTKNCFGCVGLRKKEYCILNKQYTKEEYEALVPKIIEHMKSTGEWGEYFPTWTSPYPYNITAAQDHFPLTKEDVLARGLQWRDDDKKEYRAQTYEIPDRLADVPDSILQEVLACEECGKNYKITKQELRVHKLIGLPIPRSCFNCRHMKRVKGRTPHYLWDRKCDKCGVDVRTAYGPDRPEIIYCEDCYLNEVY
jgi:hypothetical protein